MKITVAEVISVLNDASFPCESICDPTNELSYPKNCYAFAEQPAGALSFYKGDDLRFLRELSNHSAGCILVKTDHKSDLGEGPFIFVDNPHLAFIYCAKLVDGSQRNETYIHPSAIVNKGANIGENVFIGAGCVIGGATIGKNTTISAGSIITDNVKIGEHVRVMEGAVIGADGLGSILDKQGKHVLFPHFGKVIIDDHVVIGSGVIVNRGALENTTIGEYTHVSGGSFIGHNCKIGENVYIAASVSLAGSVTIGDQCYIGMRGVIKDKVELARGVTVGLNVEVHKSIRKENTTLVSKNKPGDIGSMFSLKRE